jgi:hypothetical protein
MLFVLISILVLAACGGAAAATESPALMEPESLEAPRAAGDQFIQAGGLPVEKSSVQEQSLDANALAPLPTAAAYEIANSSGDLTVIERSNRMIVKNADVRLTVKDTDVAIDRATQIIADAGGYIVSSRVWYQEYYGKSLKYASVTLGVPVAEFEKVLSKLRGLAIKVVDETAAGNDVTDQYVDLQSQLTNLEATRARIQEFLQDTKTVDEALRINQELSNIEGQIEQIKGQMNYLSDRSAFSTIALNLEPEIPALTSAPTATPIPWNPGETFGEAKNIIILVYQGIGNFLIWLAVVVLPLVLPLALILWVVWKFMNRKDAKVASQKE